MNPFNEVIISGVFVPRGMPFVNAVSEHNGNVTVADWLESEPCKVESTD